MTKKFIDVKQQPQVPTPVDSSKSSPSSFSYKLSLRERAAIIQILPDRGSSSTMFLVEDIIRKVALTTELTAQAVALKLAKYLDASEEMVRFIGDNEKEVELLGEVITFTPAEAALLTGRLKDLDNKGELPRGVLSVYRKVIFGQ